MVSSQDKIPLAPKPGDPISASDEGVMRDAMRQLYNSTMTSGSIGVNGFSVRDRPLPLLPFYARIQSHNEDQPWKHAWRMLHPVSNRDVFVDPGNGNTLQGVNGEEYGFAFHPAGVKSIPADIFDALLTPVRGPKGIIFAMTLDTVFTVKVQKESGGSAGDASNQATFTYTATTLDDTEIETGLTPIVRPSLGKVTTVQPMLGDTDAYGVGMLTDAGFRLWSVGEVTDWKKCPT